VHHLLLALATTPSPSPSPSLREGISEDQITPGLWGFIMTAFFVLATTLLIVDMVRRIRRVRYRAQVEEERLAALAAGNQAGLEAPGADAFDTAAPGTQAPGTQAPGARAPGAPGSEGLRTEPNGDEGRGHR
jgi:hypothetical protein